MIKNTIFSILLACPFHSALAFTTQLNCDDRIADGGYRIVVQDFKSDSPVVSIYEKSRRGTVMYDQQQLTRIGSEGKFDVFFNRSGIRTKMWLDDDRQAKFSFIQGVVGLVQVPEDGLLTCFEEEASH